MKNKLFLSIVFLSFCNIFLLAQVDKKVLKQAKKTYQEAAPIFDDYIEIKQNGLYGLLNGHTGEVLLKPAYDKIQTIEYEQVVVEKYGKKGIVNFDGEQILPFEYDDIYGFFHGPRGCKKGNKWGFVDLEGSVVIPFIYDKISVFDNFSLSNGGNCVLKDGEWIKINQKGINKGTCRD